jgi:hypothetical protein
LKRAKSTVGLPLISDTLVPLELSAVTLSTGTENETILVAGASVPITKAAPDSAAGVDPSEPLRELVQPAMSNAEAVSVKNPMGKYFENVLESMKVVPLSGFVSLVRLT